MTAASSKSPFPFHLLLIALYPLVFLYAANADSVSVMDMLRPALFSVLCAGLLFLIFRALAKDAARAALLATLAWAAFSAYGHVYQALRGGPGLAGLLGRHSILAPLAVGVVLPLAVVLWRTHRRLDGLARGLSLVLAAMLLLPLAQVGLRSARGQRPPAGGAPNADRALTGLVAPANPPDIYYIVLDTYTRADVIRENIGLDTTPFLDGLRQRGFFVGRCSRSNYDSTRVSLASSLNMDFIPNLDARFTPENENNALLDDEILHSKVRATLESLGYRTVAFATGFNFTEMIDADEYLAPARPPALAGAVRPFEALWLKTTALRLLFDLHPAALSAPLNALSFPHSAHVERQRFLLDRLPELAAEPGPKFIFAHVLIPHVPLVFRADGSITRDDRYFRETFDQPVSEEYLVDGYRNQVEYLNGRLLAIVDALQSRSARPPVIILQGDHGLLYFQHHPILYALSLPGGNTNSLAENITPVNTFRVVFNQLFLANLPLVADETYASSYSRPYDFQPGEADGCR